MDGRAQDRLLLHQQTRADLHFAADSKRVYSLIARRFCRTWSNYLPVIVFCAGVNGSLSLSVAVESKNIGPSITVYVGN